jgi:adenylyl-sulfate kinase
MNKSEIRNQKSEAGDLRDVPGQETISGQAGCVVWLTGLSGAGKTTIARALEVELRRSGRSVCVLDGDCVRRGLCSDLGFTPADRQENIRRVSLVARLFADAGLICIVALISPYRRDRARARAAAPTGRFLEVFINSSLEVCERRDPKGLYARARAGELRDFTGISAPYEPPLAADLELRTDQLAVGECVTRLQAQLQVWFAPPAVSPTALSE